MMTREPLLEVSDLSVDYGVGPDAAHAVVGASLTLHRGEVLGLAGESGSGKSTLAHAITRLLRMPGVITAGQVRLHDAPGHSIDLLAADVNQLRALRWQHLAIVLQSAMHALNPVMSVGAQLTDVLRAHRPELDRAARRARARELLDLVGIPTDRLASYPHELSGGMRQRVMIAMAITLNPQILIMDEPTTALDVVTQREILTELADLRDMLGFSVLFITHDLSMLIEIADTIAVMYAGQLVEQAPASQIYLAPRHPYSLGLITSFPRLHGPKQTMTGIGGSPPNLRQLPAGCMFHPRCPHAFDRCETQPPPLTRLTTQRSVACWVHEGPTAPPAELARPDSAPAAESAPAPDSATPSGNPTPAGVAGLRDEGNAA